MRATPWLAGAALLVLGACASHAPGEMTKAPTPTERYAIQVRQAPEELKLAPHTSGLSANQAEAVRAFAADWQASGGWVTIKSPEHGPDPQAAYRTANDARDALVAHGVATSQVRIVGYDAGGDERAPVVVGFMRYVAKGPQCGRAWGDMSNVLENEPYGEFGCAVTANLAAEIADPADLARQRASDPSDAGRRQVVLDHYRQGQVTSAAKDSQADATLANVGQ